MYSIPGEEENVAELQFGKDFFSSHDDKCITNDEAYLFISQKGNTAGSNNLIFDQTKKYIERVALTNNYEELHGVTIEIRDKLENVQLISKNGELGNLHPFEVASLATLIKSDGASAEEAVAWMPSLIRFEEEQIDVAISIVTEAKRRIVLL